MFCSAAAVSPNTVKERCAKSYLGASICYRAKHQSSPSRNKMQQALHGHDLGIGENVDRKYCKTG